MNRFEGKHVLLTGASAGVGQACAARFVKEGATVFGLGRNPEGLKETGSLVGEPTRFIGHRADIADDGVITEGARAAIERLGGRIDVLCNVAGMTIQTPIDELDGDLAREHAQVNFLGPLRLIDWFNRPIHLWGQEHSGHAADLAAFICFAASEEASYWNGAELRIDGGARASF